MALPGVRDIEHSPPRHHCSCRLDCFLKDFGALRRNPERHSPVLDWNFGSAAKVPLENLADIVTWPGDKTVKRHRDTCNDLSHRDFPFKILLRCELREAPTGCAVWLNRTERKHCLGRYFVYVPG